ncbi:hypothetical protein Kisp02_54250 [Kineosporia sp. NBRC 101731]|nr:hypothetical protein Kisp02_54250 [Kineosporia sp. NBRC 101731]
MSQTELGRRMGWSRQTVGAIETGVRPLYTEDIPELCEALDCTVWDLLRRVSARESRAMGLDG